MRAFASATISFGLVTVPVKVFAATSTNALSFNLITKAGNRVKQKLVDTVTNEETPQTECLKGYEYAKDQFVTFTADELKALESTGTDKTMAIQEFVDVVSVDSLYVEKSYFLGPDKGGDRGYTLLSVMMAKLGKVAIAQWTNRNRDHLVVIRPYENGLMLQQCFYEDEVRDFAGIEIAAGSALTKPEETIAEQLIKVLSTGSFDPAKYEDRYALRVKEAVERKVAGQEIAVVPEQPKTTVLDMYEALKASLAQTKSAEVVDLREKEKLYEGLSVAVVPAKKPRKARRKD